MICFTYYLNVKGRAVSKLSSKRQITLPVEQCRELGIEPGDELECFVAHGQLTLIKKRMGAANGILKYVKGNARVTDEQSRQDALK